MGYLPYQLVQDFFHQPYYCQVIFGTIPLTLGEKLHPFGVKGDILFTRTKASSLEWLGDTVHFLLPLPRHHHHLETHGFQASILP